jgi:hypothetical protein
VSLALIFQDEAIISVRAVLPRHVSVVEQISGQIESSSGRLTSSRDRLVRILVSADTLEFPPEDRHLSDPADASCHRKRRSLVTHRNFPSFEQGRLSIQEDLILNKGMSLKRAVPVGSWSQ